MLNARIYMRVSTDEQDLKRQERLIEDAKNKGFYIAGVYREKISGATEWINRPELSRLVYDLQKNDVVIAESIDRLTRLEPEKALELVNAIQEKGAKIQVPEVFDFNSISSFTGSKSSEVFDPSFLMSDLFNALQNMFLKLAVAISHDDYLKRRKRQKEGISLAKRLGKYKGRVADLELHKEIIKLRGNRVSISQTSKTLKTSHSTVIRVWNNYKKTQKNNK